MLDILQLRTLVSSYETDRSTNLSVSYLRKGINYHSAKGQRF